ncbi:MAG TPA: hypothetical protein ENN69_02065 [Spirochaetia bacterium]|nr:hypothetical protein [Spirochaetia bacterium]
MNTTDTVPTLLLEKYILGECDRKEKDLIEERILCDPALRRRLDALQASNTEILSRYPARDFTRTVRERLAAGRHPSRLRLRFRPLIPAWTAAGVAVLAAVLWLRPLLFQETARVVPEATNHEVRMKGDPLPSTPSLTLYRKQNSNHPAPDQAEKLADRSLATENDLIQIRYFSGIKKYGVILSVDGRGNVTLHYPAGPNASTALETGKEVFLPESFKLDDAPRFERFFFVTSDTPLSVSGILAAAVEFARNPRKAANGELSLPNHITQTALTLLKEAH